MRKVTIVVLAVHSLLLFRIAEAQTPRSKIELRAIKVQAGDEASVRDLAYSILSRSVAQTETLFATKLGSESRDLSCPNVVHNSPPCAKKM
jgi:hypothetical protein